jgi:hypothetical protein
MLTIPASLPPRRTGMWHDFLHRHRPGRLAIARKCMNDFTFGNETKNCVLTRHHESANILCAEPVRRPLDAGFRTYCCDLGAFPPQNALDGHRLLPSCGLAACLIDLRGSVGLARQLGAMPMTPFSSTRSISISYRRKAVSQHRGPPNRSVVSKLGCMTGPGPGRVKTWPMP